MLKEITKGGGRVRFWSSSRDGKKVAYIYEPRWDKPLRTEVHVLDLTSNEDFTVVPLDNYQFISISWSPNSEHLVLQGHDWRKGTSSHYRLWIVDVNVEEKPKLLIEELDKNTLPYVLSDILGPYRSFNATPVWADNNYICFMVNDAGRCRFYRALESGDFEELFSEEFVVYSFSVSRNGERIACLRVGYTELPEIWIYNVKSGEFKKLTKYNDEFTREITIVKPVNVKFKASDGVEVEEWYIPPADMESGKKYPVVLFVHGGPKACYGASINFLHQLLAAKGYYVIYSNPRGSDGYSEEYADIREHYGERDYLDIIEFTKHFLEEVENADSNRTAVTGISYGGFMTNWIITHTDMFKAAISENGISVWIADFWASDIGYWFDPDQIGGLPWRDKGKYVKQSPIEYVENVKTPVMFIHSMEDYRCFIDQTLAMHVALRVLGKESRLIIFKSGAHRHLITAKPRHRLKRYKNNLKFLEEKLKG